MTATDPGPARRQVYGTVAIRPLLDADEHCGLCGEPLVLTELDVDRRHIELLRCMSCGWHTRRVDGELLARDALVRLRDGVAPLSSPPDAVSWYRLDEARRR